MHGIRHMVRNRTNMLQRYIYYLTQFNTSITPSITHADNGDTQSMQCQADAVGGALGAILGIVIIALIVSIGFNIKCFMTKNGRVHSTPTKKITVKKAQGTS